MALTDDIVSYWKLDESSGNAADSVGSNTLANGGTATYAAAKINNGVVFNGSNQWLEDSSPSGIPGGASARTVSLWVKRTSIAAATFVSYGTSSVIRTYFEISGTASATVLNVDINSDGASFTVPSMSSGVFYHIVVTYPGSGTTWTLYLNGTSYTASSSGTPNTSTGIFGIGKNIVNDVQYLAGSVDEVGIWSRAITSGEVTSLYNLGAGITYPFTGNSTAPSFLLNFI